MTARIQRDTRGVEEGMKDPTILQTVLLVCKEPNLTLTLNLDKMGPGELEIPMCDGDSLNLLWSYEDKEEDKILKEEEERKKEIIADEIMKAEVAKEREKWNAYTFSCMSVPSIYKEKNRENTRECCRCIPCCEASKCSPCCLKIPCCKCCRCVQCCQCCPCCQCCHCCAKCMCSLHPIGILRFVLAPILKILKKYGFLFGCFIGCRDMHEDPDEGEEAEEQPNEEMEDQSEEKETKEGEVEMEEGKEGNWKKRFFRPCALMNINVETRCHKDRYEEEEKACGGEESKEVESEEVESEEVESEEVETEENGEQAEKKYYVAIRAAWAPAKGTEKTEEQEEEDGEEEEEIRCRCCCCPQWRCPSLNPTTFAFDLVGCLLKPLWKWMKNNPCTINCTASFGNEDEDSDDSEEMERERRLREYRERVEKRRQEKEEREKREREERERKEKAKEEWMRKWEQEERKREIKGREEEKAREERVRAKRVSEEMAKVISQDRAKMERAIERQKRETEIVKRGREEEKVREARVRGGRKKVWVKVLKETGK
ncbi:uncharacterized protein LOC143927093 [Lithobates pipiens]